MFPMPTGAIDGYEQPNAELGQNPAQRLMVVGRVNGALAIRQPCGWRELSAQLADAQPFRPEVLVSDYLDQCIQFLQSRYRKDLNAQVCHLISSLWPVAAFDEGQKPAKSGPC